jgi:hypothetical protein
MIEQTIAGVMLDVKMNCDAEAVKCVIHFSRHLPVVSVFAGQIRISYRASFSAACIVHNPQSKCRNNGVICLLLL